MGYVSTFAICARGGDEGMKNAGFDPVGMGQPTSRLSIAELSSDKVLTRRTVLHRGW
jgi:hypothetical protein